MTLDEMLVKVVEVMGREPGHVYKDENPLHPDYKGWVAFWHTSTGILEHVVSMLDMAGKVTVQLAPDGAVQLARRIHRLNG